MADERKIGDNMRRLIAHFAAREAIPPGGGIAAGIESLISPERRKEVYRIGVANAELAIKAIRAAPDNPYGDDEETIAGAILAEVEKAKYERRLK